jgi:hypothetical protein
VAPTVTGTHAIPDCALGDLTVMSERLDALEHPKHLPGCKGGAHTHH